MWRFLEISSITIAIIFVLIGMFSPDSVSKQEVMDIVIKNYVVAIYCFLRAEKQEKGV